MNKCCATCLHMYCTTYDYDACMSNGMSNYIPNNKDIPEMNIDNNSIDTHIEQVCK